MYPREESACVDGADHNIWREAVQTAGRVENFLRDLIEPGLIDQGPQPGPEALDADIAGQVIERRVAQQSYADLVSFGRGWQPSRQVLESRRQGEIRSSRRRCVDQLEVDGQGCARLSQPLVDAGEAQVRIRLGRREVDDLAP